MLNKKIATKLFKSTNLLLPSIHQWPSILERSSDRTVSLLMQLSCVVAAVVVVGGGGAAWLLNYRFYHKMLGRKRRKSINDQVISPMPECILFSCNKRSSRGKTDGRTVVDVCGKHYVPKECLIG